MPRVKPKTSRFQPNQLVKAWQAFSVDIGGFPFTVRRGTRLRADHEVVLAVAPAEEKPRFTKPTKVRVHCRVLHGPHAYEPGQTFEVPAATASWLVDEGYAEVG